IFLGFLGALTLVSALLVWWRRHAFAPENRLESFLSRETAFLVNNLIFVASMFAVMWGTIFPLISEGFFGQKIQVGPPFYNRVNIPLGLILLFLLGVGPVIAWRKATPRNLKRNFTFPLAAMAVAGVVLWLTGVRNSYAVLTFALAAFTMTTIVVEFWKGTRARAKIEGENVGTAFIHLVERNRRRYGGYVVHAGFVVICCGFAGKAFNSERQAALNPGESIVIPSAFGHSYQLTYQALSWYPATNMTKLVATVEVKKNGETLGLMTPERRAYKQREEVTSEVGIRRAWNEDLYLILAGVDRADEFMRGTNPQPVVTFKVLVNPLVPWIWLGGFIMALGTLVALWPAAEAVRSPARVAAREPATAPVPGLAGA
ncbi:MAG TPA: cytochrome c-type biogenesis CcmF C-terminal domain-containing protein, partial [Longimicrobium sp.]|nr:cytochrome c-type biogenesis CcmF C-terminal domain-containing protein [Longimicrobium sp.]